MVIDTAICADGMVGAAVSTASAAIRYKPARKARMLASYLAVPCVAPYRASGGESHYLPLTIDPAGAFHGREVPDQNNIKAARDQDRQRRADPAAGNRAEAGRLTRLPQRQPPKRNAPGFSGGRFSRSDTAVTARPG